MCDYSLQHVASRPAKVGDKLVSTKFSNSITGGFAAVGEPSVAVCLLPGTEVAFEKEVECEHTLGFISNWMGKSSGRKWLGSGKSRRSSRTCITTHSSFPAGRLCCSPVFVRVSTRLCCNCQMRRAQRRKRRSKSALLSSPNRVRRGRVVGEIEVVAEAKRKPHRDDSPRDKRERMHQENALDEALKDTFPASAPVSVEQPTPPAADRDRAKT